MSDYAVMEYVPVLGDIYRYGKLGYKIGSWFSNDSDDYNNRILCNISDYINQATAAESISEVYDCLTQAADCIHDFDGNKSKKYQLALLCFLGARLFHMYALSECILCCNDLKALKKVSKNFTEAKGYCNKVWNIDKTLFTSKRDFIDQIRNATDDKKKEIKESKSKYRKQYRALYKKEKPVKWYLGMWIFA